MDLPYNTPAGGEAVSAPEAGNDGLAPGQTATARAVSAGEVIHAPGNGVKFKNSGRQSTNWLSSYVLKTEGRAASDGLPETKDLKSSSPDAQGHKKMVTRKSLTSAAVITGAGIMMLALHSCGQKPAPAEESAAATAAPAWSRMPAASSAGSRTTFMRFARSPPAASSMTM